MNRINSILIQCLLILWFLFICHEITGQSPFSYDSLQGVINSTNDPGEKAKALLVLSENYFTTDLEKAYDFCNQLIVLARNSGIDTMRVHGYRMMSRILLQFSSYDTALIYCDSGLALATSLGILKSQADLYLLKGNSLFYIKGPESGISSYKESLKIYDQLGDSAGMSKSLNALGVMYKKMARYDSAVTYYFRMVSICERKGYESNLGMGYLNLGILYQDLHEYEKARYYLDLSIPINEKNRKDLVALAYMNIGLISYDKSEYDTSLQMLRVARSVYSSLNDRKSMADVLNSLGMVFLRTERYDSAIYYLSRAKGLFKSVEHWYSYGQVINNIALVNIELGNYNSALDMLDSCIVLSLETNNPELQKLAHYNKYYAYLNMSAYKEALEEYLIQDSLEEIIYNLEKDEILANLEMKYQNEKKQAQILALENENLVKDLRLNKRTKQRDAYLFTGIGIISIVFFGFLYFRQRTLKDKIIARQKIHQLEEEKKLLAAKSILEGQEEERKRIARELHDGLGVLLSTTKMQFSAIRDKSQENKDLIDKATKLLDQATKDVRKISHNMMPGLLTRLGLYEAVSDLFEKISETEGIGVRTDIPQSAERLPENKEIMVYRIIQELLNNTLKHAGAKEIELQMQVLPGYLDIIYTDDGKGFRIEDNLESKSLGLTSIQSRMNFLNGKIHFYSEPGKGVSYKLEIPF